MSDYDNTNSGVLFKNHRKKTDNHPDYTGTWTDKDGVEYWLSAWINESKKGTKFFSIKLGEMKDGQTYKPQGGTIQDDPAADIPF